MTYITCSDFWLKHLITSNMDIVSVSSSCSNMDEKCEDLDMIEVKCEHEKQGDEADQAAGVSQMSGSQLINTSELPWPAETPIPSSQPRTEETNCIAPGATPRASAEDVLSAYIEETMSQFGDLTTKEHADKFFSEKPLAEETAEEVAALKQYLEDGCPAKGSIGRAHARALEKNDELNTAYKKASVSQKQKLREDYTKERLVQCQKFKVHSRNHRKIDVSKGRYKLPFRILKDQGGKDDPEAIKGTKMILYRCLRMGFPYVSRDWQSGRVEFLVFERGVDELFEENWKIYEQEFSNVERQPAATALPSSCGATAVVPSSGVAPAATEKDSEGEPAAKRQKLMTTPAKPKAKGKAKAKSKASSTTTPTKTAEPLTIARNISSMYASSMTSAEDLLAEIESAESWKFSQKYGPGFTEDLRNAMWECKSAISDFQREFSASDLNDLKQKYSDAELQVHLMSFENLEPFIDAVNQAKSELLGFKRVHIDTNM